MKYISYGLYAISYSFFGVAAILMYPATISIIFGSFGARGIPLIELFLSFYYIPGAGNILQADTTGLGILIILPMYAVFSGAIGGMFFGLGYWAGRNKK